MPDADLFEGYDMPVADGSIFCAEANWCRKVGSYFSAPIFGH